ncbi:thrombospondin type 3 repeat-containing protein [Candidatus Poseidoniaceae archaeon]|nr:thrombospondin type 3 repeat-containing protein [Candidatus Poseidoniaceae archaeon]
MCDGDTDGDGLADADDAFPNDPTEQSDLDGDGVGDNTDADDDGDGVADANDNCPLIANSDQADLDGNGVGTACDGLEVTIDDNGTIAVDGDSLPALGMVGTAVAISAGFLISIRREDEE